MNIVSRNRVQFVLTKKFEELLLVWIRNYLPSKKYLPKSLHAIAQHNIFKLALTFNEDSHFTKLIQCNKPENTPAQLPL